MPSNKLTRFKSKITILTESFANSLYGGLYGENIPQLDPEDPLLSGHVHDGQHLDGHAQKINLSDHVTGQLDGVNIKDNSISTSKLDFTITFTNLLLTNDGRVIVDDDGLILTQ